MQIKNIDNGFVIENAKITGVICNDINYLDKINENIYKSNKNVGLISIKEAYDNIDGLVGDFIPNCKKLDEILETVGLDRSILNRSMFNLSTSEKILVMFAKILLSNFDVILVNNILSKLDLKLRDKVIKILIKLKKFDNKTIIISSIDVDIIFEFIDNVVIFDNYKLITSLSKYDAYNSISDDSSVEKPLVIDLTNRVLNKSGIKLGNNDSINELIKAIYREIR